MPLQRNARLDRVVRKKLRRLLFRFYEMLQREGTPPRFAKLLSMKSRTSPVAGSRLAVHLKPEPDPHDDLISWQLVWANC